MATLVALGGAALGSVTGIGANVGWIIGSIIGSLLFPAKGQNTTVEGPRLGDLTVTSSAYGAPIPIAYGLIRMSGNMIWSTGIEEVKTVKKTKSGGKGGGGGAEQTQITYSYFSTFAIAFAEGPAQDILRIWGDGKLIYDKRGPGDNIVKSGLNFRFYSGNETQLPDSLIEADKGSNAVPGFRDLVYIVVNRLPLKDFGNRVPNITAEILFDIESITPTQPTVSVNLFTVAEGGLTDSFTSQNIRPDYDRRYAYMVTGGVSNTSNFIRRINTQTMAEDRQAMLGPLDALGNNVAFAETLAVTKEGFIVARTTLGNRSAISCINPNSLAITGTFGTQSISLNNSSAGFEQTAGEKCSSITASGGGGGTRYFAMTGSVFNSVGLLHVTSGVCEYVWDGDTAPGLPTPAPNGTANSNMFGCCGGALGDDFGEGYFMMGDNGGNSTNLYKLVVLPGANHDATFDTYSGVTCTHIVTLTAADLSAPGATTLSARAGPMYDETDDTIIVQAQEGGIEYLTKIDPDNGNILWKTEVPGIRISDFAFGESRLRGGVFGQMLSDTGYAVRTNTGELFYNETGWAPDGNTATAGWWDGQTNSYFSGSDSTFTKYQFFRGDPSSGTDLADIVSDLSQRAGLAPSDIDVTDLVGQDVPGYMIGRQSVVRQSIEPLASVYFFDGVESDYVLKFILREGKSTAATITQPDLAVIDNNTGEFFRENRIQEVELPVRFTLTYMDKDNDYLQAAHNAKRLLGPTASMSSRNEMNLEIAAALSADFSKQAAEKALFSAWIERSNYTVRLPWTYLTLDPSDIVDIIIDDGTIFHTRLIQTDIGTGYSIDVTAISEDAAQYASSGILSDNGNSGLVQEFLTDTITKVILLCVPLLRDSDDTGRSTSLLYYHMGGFGQSGWTAGTLFKSIEGVNYEEVGSAVSEMAFGTAANALGDTSDPFRTDEVNTLTVFMNTGGDELSSITQLEMLNGTLNAAALIHANGIDTEVIQFRDVVQNADTSFTLSGLLRGRRGSEIFTGGHSVNDTFVLLQDADGGSINLTLGEKDLVRFYKAVTSGGLFEEALVETKASPLVDLKPYAVVLHTATLEIGDDITLDWVRRTRVGGQFQDGSDGVPISEDTEEYELEIFDGPGGTEVREVTGLTSPTYLYTSADQTTDGFSPPISQITIKVYQISAQVGRGFSQEVTINVE